MAIEHSKFNAVLYFGQFPRLLYFVQQSLVGAPRYVLDRLPVRCVVSQLGERFYHIVMLELLLLLRVVRDLARDLGRQVEADRIWTFTILILRFR